MVNRFNCFQILSAALTTIAFVSIASGQPLVGSTPVISTSNEIDRFLSQFISKNEQLALLLDFDGTLAPINPNPILTSIDPDAKRLLYSLARNPHIFMSVISGRRAVDVKSRVGIQNITYSGNHGFEFIFANQTEYQYPVSGTIRRNCSELKAALAKVAVDGAWVEDKVISLTYHYRHVPADLKELYSAEARNLVLYYGFRPVQAHGAIEIKPPIVWSKGDAAMLILRDKFGDNWASQNVRVLCAGDDNSDEDVMKNIKGKGICFRVTDDPSTQTFADFLLPSTTTVTQILAWFNDNL